MHLELASGRAANRLDVNRARRKCCSQRVPPVIRAVRMPVKQVPQQRRGAFGLAAAGAESGVRARPRERVRSGGGGMHDRRRKHR
eukprot:6206484-Pleurochrysis_carterae.AAC.3